MRLATPLLLVIFTYSSPLTVIITFWLAIGFPLASVKMTSNEDPDPWTNSNFPESVIIVSIIFLNSILAVALAEFNLLEPAKVHETSYVPLVKLNTTVAIPFSLVIAL